MKDLTNTISEHTATNWHMPRLPHIRIPRFQLQTPESTGRAATEAYIRHRFAEVHKADVSHFLPNIISLSCGGQYSAAVGLSTASSGKLFVEHYLASPVEQVISEKLGIEVQRHQIVEIGNLVSTWKGSSLLLFIVIGEVMERLGYQYVIFTGTREVKALLARVRYAPVVVGDANPALLPDGGLKWGTYYNNNPQVMFGDNRPPMDVARKNPMYRATIAAISRPIDRICSEFRAHNSRYVIGDRHE